MTTLSPQHLTSQLRRLDWYQFEQLVALLYHRLGYAVIRRGGAKADGGIDLILERDGKRTAAQCKHWQTWKVGVKTVREVLGAMTAERIWKGILVAAHGFTDDARRFAGQHRIELIDADGLTSLIGLTEIHRDTAFLELLDDTRKFCPKCDSEMILRTSRKGSNAARQFWGCSAFPKCRFTFPAEQLPGRSVLPGKAMQAKLPGRYSSPACRKHSCISRRLRK